MKSKQVNLQCYRLGDLPRLEKIAIFVYDVPISS